MHPLMSTLPELLARNPVGDVSIGIVLMVVALAALALTWLALARKR